MADFNFNSWELLSEYKPVDIATPSNWLDFTIADTYVPKTYTIESPVTSTQQSTAETATQETSAEPTTQVSERLTNAPVLSSSNPISSNRNVRFNGRNINLNQVVDTLQLNAKHPTKHKCTRYVVNALKGNTNWQQPSGVAGPKELSNLLKSEGWKDVLDSNYKPLKGDVWTIWGPSSWGLKNMHSSMYDGEKWISYQAENTTPWYWNTRGKKDVQAHIWRGKFGGLLNRKSWIYV